MELSTDSVVQISECLAKPGLCKAIDGDHDADEEECIEPGPLTAAQNSELNRIIDSNIMATRDPLIDLFIGKVRTLITNEI